MGIIWHINEEELHDDESVYQRLSDLDFKFTIKDQLKCYMLRDSIEYNLKVKKVNFFTE